MTLLTRLTESPPENLNNTKYTFIKTKAYKINSTTELNLIDSKSNMHIQKRFHKKYSL